MRRFIWLFVVASLLCTAPSAAQTAGTAMTVDDSEAARIAYEASGEIYSPFCPGKTLAMCTSSQAADVRREIQDMAKSGLTKKQIKEKVIREYGEEFRFVQADAFDDAWTFAVIGITLLLAILALFLVTRRGGSRTASDADAATVVPPTEVEDDDPYLKQVRDQYRS